jgi:hypothetical protein
MLTRRLKLYSPDSAYDSPQRSTEGEDGGREWQSTGYVDGRPPTNYRFASSIPEIVNVPPSTLTTGSLATGLTGAQQTAFASNVPFEFGALSSTTSGPSSPAMSIPNTAASTGFFPDTGYVANPANLQYFPEVPLSPVENQEEEIRVEDDEEEEEEEEDMLEPQPKRKRGRPKLNRQESSSSSKKVSQRVPHNQVERKYRETLNAEMERLRVNIPTLPQHDGSSLAGPPRPSKATVLSAAVDYIKQLEAETERLAEQNEDLKGGPNSSSAGGSRRHGY